MKTKNMSYNILITGSTGMVGKGVLLECLESNQIEGVTALNRSSLGMTHPKMKEVLLKDFLEIASVKEQIGPVDACFHSPSKPPNGWPMRSTT